MTLLTPKHIRINKYLASQNITTRRGADLLIDKGLVFINGHKAKLGDKVSLTDLVTVTDLHQTFFYFAYNKPVGIETKDILKTFKKDFLEKHPGLFPVGRLDKDSSGLIILTNDGRITDALLNPKYTHEKEYHVEVNRSLTNTLLRGLKEGVRLGRERTLPAKVRKINEKAFDIILTEGKNRQIRRMCSSFGFEVKKLERFRIIDLVLDSKEKITPIPETAIKKMGLLG